MLSFHFGPAPGSAYLPWHWHCGMARSVVVLMWEGRKEQTGEDDSNGGLVIQAKCPATLVLTTAPIRYQLPLVDLLGKVLISLIVWSVLTARKLLLLLLLSVIVLIKSYSSIRLSTPIPLAQIMHVPHFKLLAWCKAVLATATP